ncbi:hypothetical protein M2407_001072 [Serratia sp. BIGb0234]|uniref:hypothetical protein n=1 Tax=Serratia sp. BIGb0234 TaxID=2940614 RepID=UPI0021676D29|nr:hypothetical protein [Serratia sp. BIGb0234]MCS4316773.1 hypothetical protein [Serratia sp. BIGb0234]
MTKSKRISYSGNDKTREDYIFLDLLEDGTYRVREGYSENVGKLKWSGDENTYSPDEFLAKNPGYADRVRILISEFESGNN